MTGNELQKLLDQLTLNYKEFATIVGMSSQTIRKACNGKCKVPSQVEWYVREKLS